MKVLLGIILGVSVIILPIAVMFWFVYALILYKQTPKEDKIIYAKCRANFIAASVVFSIDVAIVFMFFYLSFSNFSLM